MPPKASWRTPLSGQFLISLLSPTTGIILFAAFFVDADQDTLTAMAKEDENVQRFIEGKTIRKVIVVPGKLINIVVG